MSLRLDNYKRHTLFAAYLMFSKPVTSDLKRPTRVLVREKQGYL